jgi:hypothetical protein
MPIAGILLLASMNVQAARDPRPADVTIFVSGDDYPPAAVEFGARGAVSWMYAQIGIRLAWGSGSPPKGDVHGSPVSIQVLFAKDRPNNATPEALAFALPFADRATIITVMYDRIRSIAARPASAQAILSHVLAHEIGHVLMASDGHAGTGIMKAHWNGQDYAAMARKPLEFTPDNVELIVKGLTLRKSRNAGEHARP